MKKLLLVTLFVSVSTQLLAQSVHPAFTANQQARFLRWATIDSALTAFSLRVGKPDTSFQGADSTYERVDSIKISADTLVIYGQHGKFNVYKLAPALPSDTINQVRAWQLWDKGGSWLEITKASRKFFAKTDSMPSVTKPSIIDSLNASSPWFVEMTRSWQFDSTITVRNVVPLTTTGQFGPWDWNSSPHSGWITPKTSTDTAKFATGYITGNIGIGAAPSASYRFSITGDGSNLAGRITSGGAIQANVDLVRTTATTGLGAGLGNFSVYNASTRVGDFGVYSESANDAGRLEVWTKPTGGALARTFIVGSTGLVTIPVGNLVIPLGKLGVGVESPTTPDYKIHGADTTSNGLIFLNDYVYSSYASPTYVGRKARGTFASKQSPIYGDGLVALSGLGYKAGVGFTSESVAIVGRAGETYSSSANGTFISLEVTGNGNIAADRKPVLVVDTSGLRLGHNLNNFNQTGGTNILAGDFYIDAPVGTGNATPGRLIFRTPHVGSSGSTIQTLSNLLTLGDSVVTMNGALTVLSIVPSGTSGRFDWFQRNATAPQSGTVSLATMTDTLLISILSTPSDWLFYRNKDTLLARLQYGVYGSSSAGSGNTSFGYDAMPSLSQTTNAYNNTAYGAYSGNALTTGYQNTNIGSSTGVKLTAGHSNTNVGQGAGYESVLGTNNVNIGFHSGLNDTSHAQNGNVNIGSQAGEGTGKYPGDANVFVGQRSGNKINTGQCDVGVGRLSLEAITTASKVVAVGHGAGISLTQGGNNTLVGFESGYTSVSANALITGTDNTYLGYQTGASTSTQLSFSTAIGSGSTVPRSNTIALGRSAGTDTVLIYGALHINSDLFVDAALNVIAKTVLVDGAIAKTLKLGQGQNTLLYPFKVSKFNGDSVMTVDSLGGVRAAKITLDSTAYGGMYIAPTTPDTVTFALVNVPITLGKLHAFTAGDTLKNITKQDSSLTVQVDGIYEVGYTACDASVSGVTNEIMQYAIYVNDIVKNQTITRDKMSGANDDNVNCHDPARLVLHKGDVVKLKVMNTSDGSGIIAINAAHVGVQRIIK